MGVDDDIHGDHPDAALSRDLLGVIGIVIGGQGLASACVLALALAGAWYAWSLVALMVGVGVALTLVGGLAHTAFGRFLRRARLERAG